MSKLEELIDKLCPNGVEYKTLGEIFELKNGYTPSKNNDEYWTDGDIPWFRMEDIRINGSILNDSIQHITRSAVKNKLFPKNSLMVATTATIGIHALVTTDFICNQQLTNVAIKEEYSDKLNIKFCYYYFDIIDKQCINIANQGGGMPIVSLEKMKKLLFPMPPIEVQSEIVRILDTFTSLLTELSTELDSRKKQYDYYCNYLLSTDGEVKQLGEVADFSTGSKPSKIIEEVQDGLFEYINAGTTNSGYFEESNRKGNAVTTPSRGQGGIGFVGYQERDFWLGPLCYAIYPKNEETLNPKYLYYELTLKKDEILKRKNTGGVPSLNGSDLKTIPLNIPSIKEQERIVNILDKFYKLTTDTSCGIPAEIEKRQKQYEYYRDKLLSFKEVEVNE